MRLPGGECQYAFWGRSEGCDAPGAVWRSGWVDMKMVVMVPLMLRRELSRGTFEVEYRSLE